MTRSPDIAYHRPAPGGVRRKARANHLNSFVAVEVHNQHMIRTRIHPYGLRVLGRALRVDGVVKLHGAIQFVATRAQPRKSEFVGATWCRFLGDLLLRLHAKKCSCQKQHRESQPCHAARTPYRLSAAPEWHRGAPQSCLLPRSTARCVPPAKPLRLPPPSRTAFGCSRGFSGDIARGCPEWPSSCEMFSPPGDRNCGADFSPHRAPAIPR